MWKNVKRDSAGLGVNDIKEEGRPLFSAWAVLGVYLVLNAILLNVIFVMEGASLLVPGVQVGLALSALAIYAVYYVGKGVVQAISSGVKAI